MNKNELNLKPMKKSAMLLAVLLVLALALTGCKTYKDTNGPDNYSLQSLTEQDLLKGGSCSKVGSVETNVNDRHTVRVKTLNGIDTLDSFSGSGTYTVTLSWNITKGNSRLVLCTGSEILHDFSVNESGQTFSFKPGGSRVYLRIAGEDCGYSLEYVIYRS